MLKKKLSGTFLGGVSLQYQYNRSNTNIKKVLLPLIISIDFVRVSEDDYYLTVFLLSSGGISFHYC